MHMNQPSEIAYENRLFGDVLRDLIYCMGEDTYSFVKISGIHNVMISNFLNHRKYPGVATLKKIAPLLPETMRSEFITHFLNPTTKEWSIKVLRERGIAFPYDYSGRYNKERAFTSMYKETDEDTLYNLQLQGLFKYLTAEEKDLFKQHIITYVVNRNRAMKKAMSEDFILEND